MRDASRLPGRLRTPGRDRYPIQVTGQYDLSTERGRGLAGQPLIAPGSGLVTLREVGEDEQPHPGLRRDLAGLPGGQVPVVAGQPGLGGSIRLPSGSVSR
jgi:hypothetical protein